MAKQESSAAEAVKSNGSGTPKHRSPNYPAIDLKVAAEKLPDLFKAMKRHPVGVENAAKAMGFSYKSSTGRLALAAMRAFGLFENERGAGGDSLVKLTTRALDIGTDYPAGSPEWLAAVKAAALAPKVHADLWKKYGDSLPADDELRRYLVRELKFNDNAVAQFIQEYKDTIKFAKLSDSDIIGDDEGEGGDGEGGDDGDRRNQNRQRGRLKRSRPMSTGLKEDVCSLEEGEAVFQWPENLSAESAADLDEWLKFIGKKIKRAAEKAGRSDDAPTDDDE